MSGNSTSTMLLFLRKRRCSRWKIGIPNIGAAFPLAVGLLFPDLDVLAAVGDRFTTGVNRRLLVGAAHAGKISGLRDFNLGRLPTEGSARTRHHFFPDTPNRFLCCCARSVRRHYDGVVGIKRHCFVEVLGSHSSGPLSIEVAKTFLDGALGVG